MVQKHGSKSCNDREILILLLRLPETNAISKTNEKYQKRCVILYYAFVCKYHAVWYVLIRLGGKTPVWKTPRMAWKLHLSCCVSPHCFSGTMASLKVHSVVFPKACTGLVSVFIEPTVRPLLYVRLQHWKKKKMHSIVVHWVAEASRIKTHVLSQSGRIFDKRHPTYGM